MSTPFIHRVEDTETGRVVDLEIAGYRAAFLIGGSEMRQIGGVWPVADISPHHDIATRAGTALRRYAAAMHADKKMAAH